MLNERAKRGLRFLGKKTAKTLGSSIDLEIHLSASFGAFSNFSAFSIQKLFDG